MIKHTQIPAVNQHDWQHGPGEDPGGKLILPCILYSSLSFIEAIQQSVYWKLHGIAACNDKLPVYRYLNVTKPSGVSWTFHLPRNCIRNKWLQLIPPPFSVTSWFYCNASHCSCIINAPVQSNMLPSLSAWLCIALSDSSIGRKQASAAVLFFRSVLVPGLIRF